MTYYRRDRITKQIFRRAENGSEEYNPKDETWEKTADSIAALHDSSDTVAITEVDAIEHIKKLTIHHK